MIRDFAMCGPGDEEWDEYCNKLNKIENPEWVGIATFLKHPK
jgi:hypothetical protein